MISHALPTTSAPEIKRACNDYLQRVKTVLPLDALSVVMLDPGEDTGRVVFCWRAISQAASATGSGSKSAAPPGIAGQPVMNITLYGGEEAVGGILLHSSATGGFSKSERRLARDLSTQLAIRLENAQLHRRIRATGKETALVSEVASVIASSQDLDEIFPPLIAAISKTLEFDLVAISWIDPDSYEIHRLRSADGFSKARGLELAVPIFYGKEVIGELKLYRWERPFSAYERRILTRVSDQMAPAVQGARAHYSAPTSFQSLPLGSGETFPGQQGLPGPADRPPSSINDLAHALYTPLTAIKGYASSLLQADADWPAEVQQEFLRTIDQAADHLGEVIRDLLQPAQTGQGTMDSRRSQTAIRSLFTRLESEGHHEKTNVPIIYRCHPMLPAVYIDRELIQSVIKQLIDWSLDALSPLDTLLVEACPGDKDPVISLTPHSGSQQHTGPSALPTWDTDLRVVASKNILRAQGTSLHLDPRQRNTVGFWFTLPKKPNFGID